MSALLVSYVRYIYKNLATNYIVLTLNKFIPCIYVSIQENTSAYQICCLRFPIFT